MIDDKETISDWERHLAQALRAHAKGEGIDPTLKDVDTVHRRDLIWHVRMPDPTGSRHFIELLAREVVERLSPDEEQRFDWFAERFWTSVDTPGPSGTGKWLRRLGRVVPISTMGFSSQGGPQRSTTRLALTLAVELVDRFNKRKQGDQSDTQQTDDFTVTVREREQLIAELKLSEAVLANRLVSDVSDGVGISVSELLVDLLLPRRIDDTQTI